MKYVVMYYNDQKKCYNRAEFNSLNESKTFVNLNNFSLYTIAYGSKIIEQKMKQAQELK